MNGGSDQAFEYDGYGQRETGEASPCLIPYSNSEDYRYQFFGYDITYRAIMRSPTHINIGTYFFVGLMVVIPLKEILVSGGSYG
jgi:hypothetical protein